MAMTYYKGDLSKGKFSLRTLDACTVGKQNEYIIPSGSVIKMLFKGDSGTVTLASDVAVAAEFGGGFEIDVLDMNNGECSFTLVPAQGALIAPSTVSPKVIEDPIDIIIYDSLGAQIQTFEIKKGIITLVRANA